jgi:hypothetical protein
MKHLARGLKSSNPNDWFANNRVNLPNYKEVIWEPLYDSQTYPNAGASSLLFFVDQIGKNGKTLSDTNMDLDGQLPKGKAQLVTGIQVEFFSGADCYHNDAADADYNYLDDVRAFAENGALRFRIQSKDYVRQAPLGKFPPVNRLSGMVSGSGTSANNSSIQFARPIGREFAIRDLLLESNMNFSIELIGLPALPTGIDGRIVVSLNGYSARNAQ